MDNSSLALENLFVMNSDPDKQINNSDFTLPVSTSLSFEYLIDHIKKAGKESNEVKSTFAISIVSEFEKTPELHGKIHNVEILKNHEALINNMMMFVFPESFWEVQTYAAFVPYSNDLVFSTKKFRDLNFDFPIVYKIMDPVSGLDKYYKMNTAAEFVDIVPINEI